MTNLLYTNPIGDNINIEYNNIDKYLKNKKIIDARIEDYEKNIIQINCNYCYGVQLCNNNFNCFSIIEKM